MREPIWLYCLRLNIMRWWFYKVRKMITCTACGSDMHRNDNFCAYCGFDEKKFHDDYVAYCREEFISGRDYHPSTCEYCLGKCPRRNCTATGPIGDAAAAIWDEKYKKS